MNGRNHKKKKITMEMVIMNKERFIVYDIETLNVDFSNKDKYGVPDWTGNEKIISMAYIDNKGKKDCLILDGNSFKDETDLLETFCEICEDYQFIFGYNSDKFDNPLMVDRLRRLDLRKYEYLFNRFNNNNLDVLRIAKLLHYGEDGLSLNALCKELGLGDLKDEINPIIAYKQKKYDLLSKYNIKDVELTSKCLEKMNGLDMVLKLVNLTGCKPKEVFSNTKMLNAYIESHGYKEEAIPQDKQYGDNKGGLNYYNEKESDKLQRYKDLIHYDVVSMYPSIMILINADSTYDYPSFDIQTQKPFKFTSEELERDGVIGRVAKELFDKRIETKNQMNNKIKGSGDYNSLNHEQQAYKILVNSLYGALDVKNYDLFPLKNSKLASLITSIGRNLLCACIERFGGVYGKTDSIWVPKGITSEMVNSFVDEYLKKEYNLDNKQDDKRIISFEKEADLKTLIVKSKNEYIEILDDKSVNIKGGAFKGNNVSVFETDLINKYVIQGEPLDSLEDFIKDSCKNHGLKYFSIYTKLSEKQLHQKRFNTSWLELNNIPFEYGFKYWTVYSEGGYLVFGDRVPKVPVSEEYARYLAHNRLYTVKMLEDKPKKTFEDYIPLIPVFPKKDEKGYRYAPDIKKIKEYLDLPNDLLSLGHDLYSKYDLSHIKSKYYGLLCHKNTGYFALDIDKNVDKWYDSLSKHLKISSNYWQTTRSGNYHIILKTKDKDIFDLSWKSSDVEFKNNAVVPVNIIKEGGTYKKLKDSPELSDLKNISFNRFTKIIKELKLSDSEIRKPKPLKQSELVVDLPQNVLDGIVKWCNDLWEALNADIGIRQNISSNKLMISIGNLFKTELTIEDCEYVVNGLYNIGFIERDHLNKIRSTTFNGIEPSLKLTSSIKDTEDKKVLFETKGILESWLTQFYGLVGVKYRHIFGDGILDWEKIFNENLLDYAVDYKPLIYHLCNVLNVLINKQYRIILFTDEAQSGKTFYIKLFLKFTPPSLLKISSEYQSFTLSAFKQFTNIIPDAFDKSIVFIFDVSGSAGESWREIFDQLKSVITQDSPSGYYKYVKSNIGGAGTRTDKIYSKDGLLLYIANASGFKIDKQLERRSSQIRLEKIPKKYTNKRLKNKLNNQQDKSFKERMSVFSDKVCKYLESFASVTEEDIIKLKNKVSNKHLDFLQDNTNAEDYYFYLYTCFLLLYNITNPSDKSFENFCKICQINEYNNLMGNELQMYLFLKEWAVPINPKSLEGLTDNEILEKIKLNPFKRKKQGFKFFTHGDIKSINQNKLNLDNTSESDLLSSLASKGYIGRACKNQRGNWYYYLI